MSLNETHAGQYLPVVQSVTSEGMCLSGTIHDSPRAMPWIADAWRLYIAAGSPPVGGKFSGNVCGRNVEFVVESLEYIDHPSQHYDRVERDRLNIPW